MRTAGLSLLTALTALQEITVNGHATCNTKLPSKEMPAVLFSGLQGHLPSTVSALCQTSSREAGTVSERVDGLFLELHRGEGVQDVKECQAAFTAILSQCFDTGKAFGGEFHTVNGNTYVVRPGSSEDHQNGFKFARAPTTKPKPATGRPAFGKPATGKPANGKPVANPAPNKPTPVKPVNTVSQTTIKIGPTKDCKQLALMMQKPSKRGKVVRDVEEDRGTYVGSRVAISSIGDLLKRAEDGDDDWNEPSAEDTIKNHEGTPKKGSACKITFDALPYPSAAIMPKKALHYSIDSKDGVCSKIEFEETEANKLGEKKYHIEHILEWQTVAKFFEWIDRKGKKYPNPDPEKNKVAELSFCGYWVDHWKGSYPVKIPINGKTLFPLDHVAQAYPGVDNRAEEFVWLQASINTPAKSSMWSYKGTKDTAGTLHNADKMRNLITSKTKTIDRQKIEKTAAEMANDAKITLLKLKSLLGARKYMRAKKISDIFKKQVEEMGKMLDTIDTELPNYPRKPTGTKEGKKIEKWIKQDLGKLWTEYMNERFNIAHERTNNDMDKYLKLFDETWCKSKSKPGSPAGSRPGAPKPGSKPSTADLVKDITDLLASIDINDKSKKDLCTFRNNIQKEWDKEKEEAWIAPWKSTT